MDIARRRRHVHALFSPRPAPAADAPAGTLAGGVRGTVVDASPHVLVVNVGDNEPVRLPLTASTTVWHGGRSGLHALVRGREVVARRAPGRPGIERIWVDIARVTGTVVSYVGQVVEVDGGPHRGPFIVTIPDNALSRILVRHPRLEPGFLLDVICVRSPDGLLAVRPGTSQPAHPAGAVPPPGDAPPASAVQGAATWFDSPGGQRGAAYPAVDPEGHAGGCPGASESCAPLPFLSFGSELIVQNECTGRAQRVPVIECGCVAAHYCDRCVECGTSLRGRIVELTPADFVALGGDLVAGCFNASLNLSSTAVGAEPGRGVDP